jgi:hypothetical protein
MRETYGGGRCWGRIMDQNLLRKLEERFWPKGFTRDVWMIVDSARDRRIFGLLLECFYSRHTCLFVGKLAPELEMAAPYLLQLECDDAKTRRFLSCAWGNSWGVFLKCDTRQDALRRSLRSFLTVQDPQRRRLLFRYYDPRVLRLYLPTCNSEELRHIFGPVEIFWTEDESAASLLEFRFDGVKLVSKIVALDQTGPTNKHKTFNATQS